ncbi:MAG: hypothetical protein IKD04_06585 [Clostridia bacterium]|nr:hypothetical protein [Clostridia bacterium]
MKIFKSIAATAFATAICLTASLGCMASNAAIIGDADANNKVDIRDLVRVKKFSASQADVISFDAADFDYNQLIDASDISIAKKILIGVSYDEIGVNSESIEDIYTTALD